MAHENKQYTFKTYFASKINLYKSDSPFINMLLLMGIQTKNVGGS